MKHLLITVCAFYGISCSEQTSQIAGDEDQSSDLRDKPTEVIVRSSPSVHPPGWNEDKSCIGIARIAADHSKKANSSSVLIGEEAYLFRGDYLPFAEQHLGKTIKVTGDVREGRLPMFIVPADNKGASFRQGMPMPPGTDIEKESRYYYFENPKWEVIN